MPDFLDEAEDAGKHVKDWFRGLGHDVEMAIEHERESNPQVAHHVHNVGADNRYKSFVPGRAANDAKYFVDGCGYMWAVSVAIEEARHEIWIMDWWLSPELYLRRPPSMNESYRLDRMLQAAAERGVKVNVMVYKEVEGVLSLNSAYTKRHLESLHKNIAVLRHPDHSLSGQVFVHEVYDALRHIHSKGDKLDNMSSVGLDDIVLFWAHHEKLVLIDGKLAFMGGLDLCFGRWDTHQHSIADAHPENPEDVVFPGQDYNNARIFDFQNVQNWEVNKLDRNFDARMGWSDISICLLGPVVDDIKAHFVQRWNFIYYEKYSDVRGGRYTSLAHSLPLVSILPIVAEPSNVSPTDKTAKNNSPKAEGHQLLHHGSGLMDSLTSHLHRHDSTPLPGKVSVQLVRSSSKWSHGIPTENSIYNAYIEVIKNSQYFVYIENQFFITATGDEQYPLKNQIGAALVERIVRAHHAGENYKVIVCIPSIPAFAGDLHQESSLATRAIMEFQYKSICRGGHSIMEMAEKAGVPDASKYIQFYNLRNFDRINTVAFTRRDGQPSTFSPDSARKQEDDDIIDDQIDDQVDDQIDAKIDAKIDTKVNAKIDANLEHQLDGGGVTAGQSNFAPKPNQSSGIQISAKFSSAVDTESSSYMLNGPPVTSIPWTSSPIDAKVKKIFPALSASEADAFVSEELYIHSKVLIADDRIVIVGSANLNDRSQLGTHDSEIAVVIEDTEVVASKMSGTAYQASRFAASLRRTLFRKHLGLLPVQDYTTPTNDFLPLGQGANADTYDWGSREDGLVEDPLSEEFQKLWNDIASTNTEVFDNVFRPVPTNKVRNWKQYIDYYEKHFVEPIVSERPGPNDKSKPYKYGHVFMKNFPGGVDDVKAELSKIRGTLVEMPLDFLCEVERLAEYGIAYNSITDDIYT